MSAQVSTADLVAMLEDARARTLELVSGLDQARLMGPQSEIVNPLLWEIGHLAWFHEHFILRGLDRSPPRMAEADGLYDSARVPHATRWSIPLPALPDTLAYMARVQEALVRRLEGREPTPQEAELYQLVAFHEDMHDEAFTYTRQTLGYPRPSFAASASARDTGTGPWPGDVAVGGGTWQLGAEPDGGFVFDNEKWAHPVSVAAFRIARAPVTNAEFAAFVADGGYRNPACWDAEGTRWRDGCGAEHPVYWSRRGWDEWTCRRFDRDEPLAPDQPIVHVNWYEANAYCRWAGRRLPTEIEWEAAAAGAPTPDGKLSRTKRPYPWGTVRRPLSTPTSMAGISAVSTSRPSPRATAPGAAGRCSATSGNGRRARSCLSRASHPTPTRNTRSPPSERVRSCGAAPGRHARG